MHTFNPARALQQYIIDDMLSDVDMDKKFSLIIWFLRKLQNVIHQHRVTEQGFLEQAYSSHDFAVEGQQYSAGLCTLC
jgi:hypothetical protein